MSELISGKDALIALANGEELQAKDAHDWKDVTYSMPLSLFDMPSGVFRIKPKTIKLELEIPAPFEPKDGDVCFTFDSEQEEGVFEFTYREDSDWHKKYIQFGVWDSLDKAEKVVAALRSIKK